MKVKLTNCEFHFEIDDEAANEKMLELHEEFANLNKLPNN